MGHTLFFKIKFVGRLKNVDQNSIREALKKLSNDDTIINISRLCRTRLEGSIKKPSYDKDNKKPNPRNSFALIKRVKLISNIDTTKITISEDH